jgi:hypothetical protein
MEQNTETTTWPVVLMGRASTKPMAMHCRDPQPQPQPPYIPPPLSSFHHRFTGLAEFHREQRKTKEEEKYYSTTTMAFAYGLADLEQAGSHQGFGHKSLLQSDALYQVSNYVNIYIYIYIYQLHYIKSFSSFLVFETFLFLWVRFCSIYWTLVCTQESMKP